jgi:septum formation protein
MAFVLPEYPSLRIIAQHMHLILGSNSATRKLILNQNGFRFNVVKADIDERAIGNRDSAEKVEDLVTLLANAKADAILTKLNSLEINNHVLLTSDQVVTHKNKILEKPLDEDEARTFISSYSNSFCTTVGSICLTDLRSLKRVNGVDRATIHFGTIPEEIIDNIINEGEYIHCAGGLMVEHPLLQPYITKIDGTVDSLMGLSCPLLYKLFTELYN